MSTEWRELLDRVLEGEELSGREAELLARALCNEERRSEALALLGFEGLLRQHLARGQDEGAALSRERLLAKAALREKALSLRAGAPHRLRRVAVAAAAAFILAAVATLVALSARGYPEPQASGDYCVVGSPAVGRGARLAVGDKGAELRLGGYCRLTLDPNTEVVVRGATGREAVELERGRVASEITPGKGQFVLLTPIGSVQVKGTRFLTSVEYPDSLKGERDMGKLRKSAVVTVMVVTGVVACHFGDVAVLGPGMSQVFAGGEGERTTLPPELKGFKGIIVGTITSEISREFNLKIEKIATVWPESKAEAPERAVGKTVEIVVGQNRMLEQHLQTLKAVRKGDKVIVEAFDLQGFRLTVMELFRKAEGSGERREGEGEGEVREKRTERREGEGEVREKRVPREGEGEVREKRTERREGEGEWREKRTERREGEGEVREKRTEPRAEGMKELTGWVKATPDRDCLGILKVVERAETEEGVREKAVVYRVMREGKGEVLVREASGRRVRVAGVVTPGEGEPAIVIKEFRLLDAPAGEGERREKKIERREGEGEGEAREKPVRREGEGEWREKRPERREGEGEVREKRTEGEGGEERPKPRVEAGSVASPEILVGFRGMIEGTVVGKASDAIILRVDKVVKTWQSSTAKKPEALVGKLVSLTLKNEPNPNEALVKAVGEVKAGDRVLAGAIHLEGKAMQLVEVLRKLEAE